MTKKKTYYPIGKKPTPISKDIKKRPITKNITSEIKNKFKRADVYGRYLTEKKKQKKERRLKRLKEVEELGADAPARQTPRTIENTREAEVSMIQPDDEEVIGDEAEDEFAPYFSDEIRPKIIITTRPEPSSELFHFIHDLMQYIPQMFYYPRRGYTVKQICEYGQNRNFTHLIVLSEKYKKCNGMIVSHLRSTVANEGIGGPTAFFKVSNYIPSKHIPNHGRATSHIPELVLNNFGTRLGHRVGRLLGSLFPHNAQFRGRQVATFHNQRDYIFVRHHRYIFEPSKDTDKDTGKKKTKARLQELGPRFTLKMRWLQVGMFDTHFGEYEWFHKRKEMDTTRRKFHL